MPENKIFYFEYFRGGRWRIENVFHFILSSFSEEGVVQREHRQKDRANRLQEWLPKIVLSPSLALTLVFVCWVYPFYALFIFYRFVSCPVIRWWALKIMAF